MPEAIATIGGEQRATVVLRQLPAIDEGINVGAFARLVNDPALLSKRLLLLDASQLASPDALRTLLASPKGWLCTLDHKSCQNAC